MQSRKQKAESRNRVMKKARRHLRILKAIEHNPTRRGGRRLHIPQGEFGYSAGAFNLAGETGSDGDRLAREREERDRARAHAAKGQTDMFKNPLRHKQRGRTGVFTGFDGKKYFGQLKQVKRGIAFVEYSVPGRAGKFQTFLPPKDHRRFKLDGIVKNPRRRKLGTRNPKRGTRGRAKLKKTGKTRRVVLRTIIRREVITKNPRRARKGFTLPSGRFVSWKEFASRGTAPTAIGKDLDMWEKLKARFRKRSQRPYTIRKNPRRRSRKRGIRSRIRRKRSVRSIHRNPRRAARGRVVLLVIRPNKYVHTFAQPTRDAVAGELRKEWGRSAPQFVAAVCRQMSEHRGYEWTKRIMGNVVHFTKL